MSYSILEQDIIEYNKQYREGNPTISDQQFDYLMERLKREQPDSDLLKSGVLEVAKESRKEKLPIPMFSLEKDKSVEEFQKHLSSNGVSNETECVISGKLDGISLVKDEGVFVTQKAWTRGDGEVGQESTIHFNKMNNKPSTEKHFCYSYGEAILSKANWNKHFLGKISPHTGKPYKSARNLVGGLLNADDARDELQYVDYIRYGLSNNRRKTEMLAICNTLNVVEFEYYICKAKDITEDLLDKLYQEWSEKYQIDGVVIDINDYKIRGELGRERNNNPKYARAIKLPKWGENAIVKVLGITWQVSKQGNLKPVINIEPTDIGGATISNVTAYNAKYLFDNHICVGSIIEITRSGDVIPKHLNTISYDEVEFKRMREEIACPSCGGHVFWDETNTELFCINPDCRDRMISKLVHFFKTLEVEEFGEPTIIKVYDKGYKTPLDVLKISYKQLLSIDGFAEKSANKLFDQFNKLKNEGVSFAKLIHATDVMEGRLGSKIIQLILDNVGNPYNQKVENLITINGIADKTANIFICGMQVYYENYFGVIEGFITVKAEIETEVLGDKFDGFKICFTGVRPSKEQEDLIKSQGGEIVSGVSKNTSHLVVKDLSAKTLSSGKSVTAKGLGIKILTLEELFK